MYVIALLVVLAGLFACGLADSSFSNPPGPGKAGDYSKNPVYNVGEKITAKFESDFKFRDLVVWQDYPTGEDGSSMVNYLFENSTESEWDWRFYLTGFERAGEGEQAVFYLALYKAGADIDDWDTTCHYFNISTEAVSGSESSAEPSTEPTATGQGPTRAPAPTSPKATSATETAKPTSTDDQNKSLDDGDEGGKEGMSAGTIAGISVGATLGGMLVLSGICFFVWRSMRNKKSAEQQSRAPVETLGKYSGVPYRPWGTHELDGHGKEPVEMYAGDRSGPKKMYEAP